MGALGPVLDELVGEQRQKHAGRIMHLALPARPARVVVDATDIA